MTSLVLGTHIGAHRLDTALSQCVGKGVCCPGHVTNFSVVPTLPVSLMPHSDIIVSCTYIFWPQEVSITKTAEYVVSSPTPDNLKRGLRVISKHLTRYLAETLHICVDGVIILN